MDWNTIEHFTQDEWEPHSDRVNPKLIYLMDNIRDVYDKKLFIHCAFAQSGHAKKSQHYLGNAVDFHFEDDDYAEQFKLLASYEDVGGIGFYGPGEWTHPGFHLDIRPERIYWTQRNGIYVYGLSAIKEDVNA